LTQEKAIRFQEKPLIPADIVQSDLALQSYLVENVKENKKHELIRQRIAKAQRTRINHSLEAAARKIKVEPAGPEPIQQTKTWKCKKATKQMTLI